MIEKMYTVKELAEMMGKSDAAIRQYVHRKQLKPVKRGLGLFYESEVKKFLNGKYSENITEQEIRDLAQKDYITRSIKQRREGNKNFAS